MYQPQLWLTVRLCLTICTLNAAGSSCAVGSFCGSCGSCGSTASVAGVFSSCLLRFTFESVETCTEAS